MVGERRHPAHLWCFVAWRLRPLVPERLPLAVIASGGCLVAAIEAVRQRAATSGVRLVDVPREIRKVAVASEIRRAVVWRERRILPSGSRRADEWWCWPKSGASPCDNYLHQRPGRCSGLLSRPGKVAVWRPDRNERGS